MTRRTVTGSGRHAFATLVTVHASGAEVRACRCGLELLARRDGVRLYRSGPAQEWTRHAPAHVEKPEPTEVVVGDTPGHYPPMPGARWTH